MLVINYKENKPISDYFKYSVNGNNQADIVRFVLLKEQEGIDLGSEDFKVYAKCTDGYNFVDKVLISSEDIEITDSEIIVDWHLLRKHTANESLKVSVSFESEEIVWQTQSFTLKINNGVLGDEEMENTYPTIIAKMQKEIEELKKQKGGGASEVLIDRVYLTYDEEKSIRSDYLGLDYHNGGETKHFINDSTRIWVNFITTPINDKMEEEIKNGRFVIRLDYPLKNRSQSSLIFDDATYFERQHTSIKKYGVGTRGFVPSFNDDNNEMRDDKKEILLNSLIFVNESDIRVNSYGEKYIHKKVSLFDYINNICSLTGDVENEKITLAPITMDWINNNENGDKFFVGYLLDVWSNGIPHTFNNGEDILRENSSLFAGTKRMKMFKGLNSFPDANVFGKSNSVKLNPAFACYTVLKSSEYPTKISLYSPYYVGTSGTKYFYFSNFTGNFVIAMRDVVASKRKTKKAYMSARPRCCILNDNYETNDKAFIKKYPQADQQIRLYCKCIKDIDEDGIAIAPIFRMLITQK